MKVNVERLKTAIDTGDHRFYHGDVREGVLEALDELAEAREQLEEIKDILGLNLEMLDKPLTDSGESDANSAPLSTPK